MTGHEQVPVVQQQPVAVVTLQEIYSTLQGVERTVREIDNKLAEVVKDSEDHETRIRALEARVWKAAGSATVLASGAGFLLSRLFGG